jgi:hypothetical protein
MWIARQWFVAAVSSGDVRNTNAGHLQDAATEDGGWLWGCEIFDTQSE